MRSHLSQAVLSAGILRVLRMKLTRTIVRILTRFSMFSMPSIIITSLLLTLLNKLPFLYVPSMLPVLSVPTVCVNLIIDNSFCYVPSMLPVLSVPTVCVNLIIDNSFCMCHLCCQFCRSLQCVLISSLIIVSVCAIYAASSVGPYSVC